MPRASASVATRTLIGDGVAAALAALAATLPPLPGGGADDDDDDARNSASAFSRCACVRSPWTCAHGSPACAARAARRRREKAVMTSYDTYDIV